MVRTISGQRFSVCWLLHHLLVGPRLSQRHEHAVSTDGHTRDVAATLIPKPFQKPLFPCVSLRKKTRGDAESCTPHVSFPPISAQNPVRDADANVNLRYPNGTKEQLIRESDSFDRL